MPVTDSERIAVLERDYVYLKDEVGAVTKDIREIKDSMREMARWRRDVWIVGVALLAWIGISNPTIFNAVIRAIGLVK